MRLLGSLLLLWVVGCSEGEAVQDKPTDDKPEPVTVVNAVQVGLGEVADVVTSGAVVESESEAEIIPSAAGVVLSVHRDEGDPVRAGELLAVLENVGLDAGAERARDELSRLQAQYDELRELHSRGAVSERELEDLAYQLQTARTSNREAEKSFGQTRLTAPFDGVVASRDVRVGQLAGSGGPAFRIVDLDKLRAVTTLPERDLERVALAQPAKLTSAYNPDSWTTGTVTRIAPVIDPQTGTFRVTIALDADQTVLRPGQFVTIELEVDRRREVVVVPRKAVVYEDGAPVVYRMAPPPEEEEEEGEEGDDAEADEEATASWWPPSWLKSGDDADDPEEGDDAEGDEVADGEEGADEEEEALVAKRSPVELGLVDGEYAQIVDGVVEGDEVIVLGQSHLRDGARVRAVADPPEEGAAGEGERDGDQG